MKSIKVNYINSCDVRTSTTLSRNICIFYCEKVLGMKRHPLDSDRLIIMEMNNFALMGRYKGKDEIERALLEKIHQSSKETDSTY